MKKLEPTMVHLIGLGPNGEVPKADFRFAEPESFIGLEDENEDEEEENDE